MRGPAGAPGRMIDTAHDTRPGSSWYSDALAELSRRHTPGAWSPGHMLRNMWPGDHAPGVCLLDSSARASEYHELPGRVSCAVSIMRPGAPAGPRMSTWEYVTWGPFYWVRALICHCWGHTW